MKHIQEGDYIAKIGTNLIPCSMELRMIGPWPDTRERMFVIFHDGIPRFPMPLADALRSQITFFHKAQS